MLHFIIEDKVLIFIYSNSTVNPLQLIMIFKDMKINPKRVRGNLLKKYVNGMLANVKYFMMK
jgi:hypothetical protein